MAVAVLALALLLSPQAADASPTPPASGDWTVGPGETVTQTGANLDLHGDLHVRGSLTLDNSTLWVWLDAGAPRELLVHPGGELRLVNSALAARDLGRPYVLQAEAGSVLVLDRSSVWRAGDRLTIDGLYAGIHVATGLTTIRDTVFTECLAGLWVSATDVTVTGCDFVDSRYGAVVDGGGRLVLEDALFQGCVFGALTNASAMVVTESRVVHCDEGLLAYGGNLTVTDTEVTACTIVGAAGYSADVTLRGCLVHTAEADGVIVHEGRGWIVSNEFHDLLTDVKVVHSEAWLVGNRHEWTYDEGVWAYHSTFHLRDMFTFECYWALRGWKSRGEVTNLTATNTTYGAYLERCEDVLIDGLHVDQDNLTRRTTSRGVFLTGGHFILRNATIEGVRTGIDMLSTTGEVEHVRIDDCYQDGVMVSLSWFYTMTDVNVTRADDGFWLNLYSGGRLERCQASLCRASGFNFSAGATTVLVECNSSANPVGVSAAYASPVIRDCDMFMCDNNWALTNETLGMDLFSGSPQVLGGTFTGGFGGIRLNGTNALVQGVYFTKVERWAVQVRESVGDTIDSCTFVNMSEATAIFAWRGSPVITGNTFFRVNYGMTGADGSHLVVEDNSIVNVTYDGIWIVANSSADMSNNLVRDVGYYGIHIMLYSDVVSRNDVIRDVGSYCVFVWKASSFDMGWGAMVNCSVGIYAFDATDVAVSYTELRDLNRGIVSYKDRSSNALTYVQHVRVEGCYFTNHSAYALGVFDVNLTVVDCNFLDNIAAIQANNATVDVTDCSLVGSWLFGVRAEGSSRVQWTVRGMCRILSSDLFGRIDLRVEGGQLIMDDVLVEPSATSSLTSSAGSYVELEGCEWRANGAVIRLRGSRVDLGNSTFTAVGPAIGGGEGNLGVALSDCQVTIDRCNFRRTRAGLSLVSSNATVTGSQFTECGEFGIYARASDLRLVQTRINRTMVGDAIHLDGSNLLADRSVASIGVNGLVMIGSRGEMYNCSLGGSSGHSLLVDGSTLVLMNTTYQSDRTNVTAGGEVEVWWLLTVRVLWPDSEELGSATVWVEDVTGTEVFRHRPNAAGVVRWIPVLVLVHQDGEDSPHGPHTVSADLFGYTVSHVVTLTASGSVLLDLKDLDPPTFQVLGPTETELWVKSAVVDIFGTAIDAGSGTEEVRVWTDYNPTSHRSEGEAFSFQVRLTDGRHVIELKAVDRGGNSATYSLVVWVETDPLVMSPPDPADGTLTRERTVTLTGRLSRVDGVTVRVNRVIADLDGMNKSYSVLMDLQEGENGFSILVEDIYGHQTWWNLTITADWTAPDLVLTSPLEVNTTDEWVEITGHVDADARLFIQGSLVLLREGSFSVKYPVYVGETAVSVRAEDGIGNSEELQVLVFRREVETEPPSANPWEVYIFLVLIPILMMAVYIVLRRIEYGGDEG